MLKRIKKQDLFNFRPIFNKLGVFLNIKVFINKLKYCGKNYKINRKRFNKIS